MEDIGLIISVTISIALIFFIFWKTVMIITLKNVKSSFDRKDYEGALIYLDNSITFTGLTLAVNCILIVFSIIFFLLSFLK